MIKKTIKIELMNEYFNSDKTNMSWRDFMETEIQDSKEKSVVDREEDF